MKVYQLELLDLGFCLEPVFASMESAQKVREKYPNRKIKIKSLFVSDIKDNIIYRIKNTGCDGYSLEESIFSNLEAAESHLKDNTQEVIKEHLYG
ncbi:MAG: hypothetical protein J1F35_01710 [Erysipelotrichales bacterium]|nr:hypothetical protein [Erysipelotrichales bacterium]